MPVNVISRKFWNQLRNGKTFASNTSDFTDFLQATICEKIKTETTIDIFWKSKGQQYVDEWSAIIAGGVGNVNRQIGSFLDDEFSVGDTIYWVDSVWGNGTGVISSVNDLTMIFTSATGSIDDSLGLHYNMTIWGTTTLSSIIFKFNLIENSAADSFISLVDGNTIKYAGSSLTATDTLLTAQGSILSWKDESVINVKTGTSGVTGYQRFIITHEFWVTPFYLPSQYSDLQNGIAPSYLKDVASLKYIANYELRQSIFNPNISHSVIDSMQLGDVSWFDEHFNGFSPIEFNKQSIAYTVSGSTVTELYKADTTHVIIEINSVNNLFSSGNTNFIVNLFMLPINESEYKNTLTDMFTNYVFEQCFSTIGAASASGDYGIFTNVLGTIVSNRLHIEFDVDFSVAQRLLIDNRQYIISVITDDYNTTHATSKEINVLCDYNSFSVGVDNPLLVRSMSAKYWEHSYDPTISGTGTKNFRGWITDGVYSETTISVNSVAGILNYLKFKIRALNTATLDEFDLMTYDIDLSPYPVISGIRQVNFNTTRGFKLITGSLRNLVSLTNVNAIYTLKLALKLRWEDWVQLLSAHQDFYNSTLLNNGLSQKWSNYYDTVSNWVLKIDQIATVEDISTGSETNFDNVSLLDCHNFGEDGNTPPLWSLSIETFKGATSLGVDNSAVYANDADTLIVATFTSINALLTSDLYGIIYLEQYQNGGLPKQWQLSSEELPAVNNWLKPISGETKAKVTILSANKVKVEALIDYTKTSGKISIAARIGYKCYPIAEVRASQTISELRLYLIFDLTRFFDLTINGIVIATNHAIPSPYGISTVCSEIKTISGGYDFIITDIPFTVFDTGLCQAPIGNGSGSNGDIIIITFYNSLGVSFGSVTWTLSGGIDSVTCSGVLTATNRKLLEDGYYKKLEDDNYRNLES